MGSIDTVATVDGVQILRGVPVAPGELILALSGMYLVDEQRHFITFHDTEYGLKGAIEYIKEQNYGKA